MRKLSRQLPDLLAIQGNAAPLDATLAQDDVIVFDAWTHAGALKIRGRDFADQVHPQVKEFYREPSKREYSAQKAHTWFGTENDMRFLELRHTLVSGAHSC